MYNLKAFRERVRQLYTPIRTGKGEKRPTQKELARAVGLNQTELSNRLNATKGAHLSERDIKAIVLTLTEWGALDSRAQVDELLSLVDCPPFSAAEWASPRLHRLAHIEQTPPAHPPLEVKTNLPAELSSFVGRKRELAALRQLLDQTRLITLSGAAGSGKTRLALRLGHEQLRTFCDGVFLVDLATTTDPLLVPQLITKQLNIKEQPGQDASCVLEATLKTRQMLLILDNCEQVSIAIRALAHRLLVTCSNLRLIITSREKLGIDGEVNFAVMPLSLPPQQAKTSVHSLTKYEAIRLFIERANSAAPSFHLTQANAHAVREICTRLDGIPLALELAASWINVLDAAEICIRLHNCLGLMVSGTRSSGHRHPTIKASLDWSYDLLSVAEQRLFSRLAVFSGSFTLAAAEQVCADAGLDATQIFNLLGQLVDKSLVLKSDQSGSLRFTMLEIIRDYARQQLEQSGEYDALRRRHAAFYLSLTQQAGQRLGGSEQANWLAELSREYGNLHSALTWANREPDACLLLRLAGGLWRYWYIHGHLSEGRFWLAAALDKASGQEPELRATALYGAGNLAWSQGDYAAATCLLTECLALYRAVGDEAGCSMVLSSLGNVAASQGDYAAAYDYYEAGLIIKQRRGDQAGIAAALNNLATVATMQGNHLLAQRRFEESVVIFEQLGNERGVATALNNLGDVIARQGQPQRARTLHERSLAIRQRLGDRYGSAAVLHSLGQSDYLAGNYPAAARNHAAALQLRYELNDRYGITCSLDAFAILAVNQQHMIRAVRLFAAAERLRNTFGAQLPPPEREERDLALAAAQSHLDAITFATVWAEGERFDFSQAVSYALDEAEQSLIALITDVSALPTPTH